MVLALPNDMHPYIYICLCTYMCHNCVLYSFFFTNLLNHVNPFALYMFYTVSFILFILLTAAISMYCLVTLFSGVSSLLVLVLAQMLLVNLEICIICLLISII